MSSAEVWGRTGANASMLQVVTFAGSRGLEENERSCDSDGGFSAGQRRNVQIRSATHRPGRDGEKQDHS